MKALREALSALGRNQPGLLLLICVLSATLPKQLSAELSWTGAAGIAVCSVFLIGLFVPKRLLYACAIVTLTGFLCLAWGAYVPEEHYTRQIASPCAGVNAGVRIVEATLPAQTSEWLPMPGLIRAEVEFIGLAGDTEKSASGRVMLRLPYDFSQDSQRQHILRYGALLRVEGTLLEPEGNDNIPSIRRFDFKDYLERSGAPRILEVDRFERLRYEATPFSIRCAQLGLSVRDTLLKRMTAGLPDETKRLTAALVFGCKQGLLSAERVDYVRAGTLHVFAVSGLHIGMLALLLGGLLRIMNVPFRKRGVILSLLLLGFVLSTGLQPSAFRAWVMVSVFALNQGMLRRSPGLNTLMLAAVVLLLIHPPWIFDVGFQYSFGVTFFLILGWRTVLGWIAPLTQTAAMVPAAFQSRAMRLRNFLLRKALSPLGSAFVALGASAPLMAYYNGCFIPFSLFANVAVIPASFAVMSAGFFKLFSFCAWTDAPANLVLRTAFAAMNWVSGGTAGLSGNWGIFGTPPLWMIFGSFGLLILFLKSERFSLGAFGVWVSLLCLLPFLNIYAPASPWTGVFHGGGCQRSVVLNLDPESGRTFCVNTGDYMCARTVTDFLKSRGFRRIDTLMLTGSGVSACGGLRTLLKGCPVRTLVVPGRIVPRSQLSELLPEIEKETHVVRAEKEGEQWHFQNAEGIFRWSGKSFSFEPEDAAAWGFEVAESLGGRVDIRNSGGEKSLPASRSLSLSVVEYAKSSKKL